MSKDDSLQDGGENNLPQDETPSKRVRFDQQSDDAVSQKPVQKYPLETSKASDDNKNETFKISDDNKNEEIKSDDNKNEEIKSDDIKNEDVIDADDQFKDYESNSSSNSSESSHLPPNPSHLLQLVDQLSESELLQYESFRRSGFSRALIKKLVNLILGQACNPNFIIAVSGISKVFVGEMVTRAKHIQKKWGQNGPLNPSHIHEAYRQLYGDMPNTRKFYRFFDE